MPQLPSWYKNTHVLDLLQKILATKANGLEHNFGRTDSEDREGLKDQIAYCFPIVTRYPNFTPPNVSDQLKTLLTDLKNNDVLPKKLIVPIQVGQDHWTCLAIAPNPQIKDRADIAYINSFGFGSYADDQRIIDATRSIFPYGETFVPPTRFQNDAQSCGPIVVNTAEIFATVGSMRTAVNKAMEIGRHAKRFVNITKKF